MLFGGQTIPPLMGKNRNKFYFWNSEHVNQLDGLFFDQLDQNSLSIIWDDNEANLINIMTFSCINVYLSFHFYLFPILRNEEWRTELSEVWKWKKKAASLAGS